MLLPAASVMPAMRFISGSADWIAAAPCMNLLAVLEGKATHAEVPR